MKNDMKKDRITGLVLVFLGVLITIGARTMKVTMRLSAGDPGPRLFLYIAAIGLMICGAGCIVSTTPDTKTISLKADEWKRFITLLTVLICYLVGLKVLGFLISTPLAICGVIYILKQKKKISFPWTVVYSIVLTAILYLIFVKVLSIILPQGMFF